MDRNLHAAFCSDSPSHQENRYRRHKNLRGLMKRASMHGEWKQKDVISQSCLTLDSVYTRLKDLQQAHFSTSSLSHYGERLIISKMVPEW
jgi:hypothetical protein